MSSLSPFQLVKLIDGITVSVNGAGVPNGVNAGDILRWDSVGGGWEVVEEPFIFDEVQLTPKASSTGPEGTVFFCSGDKYLYVAVGS
jgi:hypothetical protein